LLDRIDIQLDVRRVEHEKLTQAAQGETSQAIRERVEGARALQHARYAHLAHISTNSDLGASEIDTFCKLDKAAHDMLEGAMKRFQFSARAYHRILKLSRTIADLAQAEAIDLAHVAEAIQYRARTLLVR
jgi:magnesium chelatase family protein